MIIGLLLTKMKTLLWKSYSKIKRIAINYMRKEKRKRHNTRELSCARGWRVYGTIDNTAPNSQKCFCPESKS